MADTNLLSDTTVEGASDHHQHHQNVGNNVIILSGAPTQTGQTLINNYNNTNSKIEKIDEIKLKKYDHNTEPPDGGMRAWLVMISAFLCNSILFGVINTYGVIYLNLQNQLTANGDLEASSKAALVGSLTIGTTFLLSPVSGILTDKIGLRYTTLLGGLLAAGGMFLSSVCIANIYALYFTYGIMFGLGAAFAYTPTLAILGHYFKKYLGIVSGFVTSGSSVFTAILPSGLKYLLNTFGLQITFCVLGAMTMFIIICALIYKPTRSPPPPPKRKPGQSITQTIVRSLVNVNNWKKKRYIIWALSIPVALIGYFVPYVHMAKLVQITFPNENENFPIVCIGITSGIGRLIFGYIADFKGVNRIMLQQISFIVMGILTMTIPLTKSYPLLLAITLGIGIVDGCFISLLGPIAFDICGPHGATQAIGFLLGLCSIPLTVGPPIAGMIYDHSKSYILSFILAGIPPLIGASMMCLTRFVDDTDVDMGTDGDGTEQEHEALAAKPAWIEDGNLTKSLNGNCISSTDGAGIDGIKISSSNGHIKDDEKSDINLKDTAFL